MNNLLLPLQFINEILSKITFFIAMAIVCVMVLALSASALTRYISGHGFDWFIELPPALVSWLVFPMLGPLLKTGNHIEVDFVSTILSAKSIKQRRPPFCNLMPQLRATPAQRTSCSCNFLPFTCCANLAICFSDFSEILSCCHHSDQYP